MTARNESMQGFGPCNAATGRPLDLAMQELWLSGSILPVGAHLSVRHVFTAAGKRPAEVVYAFALPRDASLHRFRVLGKDFSVNSELVPVEEARKTYEAGIEAGHLSTLAQMYRDGVVNLNVGNIQPGETVAVYLELAAGVEARDGGFRFRFPFTLAPGYHAKARAQETGPGRGEIEVPPDSFGDVLLPTWVKDATDLHRVGFELNVETASGVLEIASPSHAIRVRHEKEQVQVLLATEKDVPNRDLVLDVRLAATEPVVLAGIDSDGHGRFAVSIPSTEFGAAAEQPQRVVFLLDRSGSMDGLPLQQACRALEACLGALSEKDRFGLVAFDDSVLAFREQLAAADSATREEARHFLRSIEARGGTELLAGIQTGRSILGEEGGDLFVFTDGQVSGTENIIAEAKAHNFRLHCLGIGSASQDRFLALLARETGGTSRFVTPRERVDMTALELFAGSGSVVAQELVCSAEGLPGAALSPVPPQQVYGGTPVLLLGRCDGEGHGRLRAGWKSGDKPCGREWPLRVEKSALGDTLKLIQGARLISDAEASITEAPTRGRAAERNEHRRRRSLEKLSREYGLASRAMALVAVLKRTSDRSGELPETSVVPVGMPEDTNFESCFTSPQYRLSSPNYFADVDSPVLVADMCLFQEAPSSPLARDMGIQSFLRKRMQAGPPVARRSRPEEECSAPADEELLVVLAGQLEGDGGLPGKSIEERIARSLAALAVFSLAGSTLAWGTFSAHMKRLLAFLERVDASALSPTQTATMARILERIRAGAPMTGEWSDLAEKSVRSSRDDVATSWDQLAEMVTL